MQITLSKKGTSFFVGLGHFWAQYRSKLGGWR